MARNHNRRFRPLRAGIEIKNPGIDRPGTLGMFALDADGGRWLVSCAHVLAANAAVPEPIFQPDDGPDNLIARTVPERIHVGEDCAAARLLDDVSIINEVLGIGPLGEVEPPQLDMRVLKSGAETGVTEATIVDIDGDIVTIHPDGLPSDYEANLGGDSGAVWVSKETRGPVALHQGGSRFAREAFGISIAKALALLQLRAMPRVLTAGGTRSITQ